MDVVWSALFAVVYFLWRRDSRGAWVIFGLVISHWVLDFVSHRPEMPIAPGLDWHVGLGLWNSLPATFAVEEALWLAGVAIYLRCRLDHHSVSTCTGHGGRRPELSLSCLPCCCWRGLIGSSVFELFAHPTCGRPAISPHSLDQRHEFGASCCLTPAAPGGGRPLIV